MDLGGASRTHNGLISQLWSLNLSTFEQKGIQTSPHSKAGLIKEKFYLLQKMLYIEQKIVCSLDSARVLQILKKYSNFFLFPYQLRKEPNFKNNF